MPEEVNGWALLFPDGRCIVEAGPDANEDDLWRFGLGFPTVGEVRWHKENGTRAFPCRIVEMERSAATAGPVGKKAGQMPFQNRKTLVRAKR